MVGTVLAMVMFTFLIVGACEMLKARKSCRMQNKHLTI